MDRPSPSRGASPPPLNEERVEPAFSDPEALLRAVIDAIPDPIFVKDRDSRWLHANRATLDALGKTAQDVLGKTDREIYADPSIAEPLIEADRRVVEAGTPAVLEERVEVPGGFRFGLSTKSPLRAPDGRVVGIVGIARDITEWLQAEKAVRRANRALLMLTRCNEAVLRATSERDLLAEVCDVVVRTGGYRMVWIGVPEDDARRTVRPVAHAGHEEGYLSAVEIVWADTELGRGPTGTAIRERRPVVGYDFAAEETLAPWKQAALARGYRSSSSFPLAHEGVLLGVLAMYAGEPSAFDEEELQILQRLADDVAFGVVTLRRRAEQLRAEAERARAEEALRKSEERFRALIEKATDIIVVVDADARVRFWSPSGTEALGWRSEDVAGRVAFDFAHPDDRKLAVEKFHDVSARPGSAARFVARIRHADGSTRLAEVIVRNLLQDAAVGGIVANIRDITEQRRLEEQFHQAQRLESVGRLAGGVAHDFNNLLTVILSCAEVIGRQVAAGSTVSAEDVGEIQAAGERAAELTRQLLAFARRQVIAPVPLDLNAIVLRSEKLLRRVLGEDVELRVQVQPDPWTAHCDPGQVEQVLMNLAVNARDAMPGGGRLVLETRNAVVTELSAAFAPDRRAGEWVQLLVRDSGAGMTPEVKAHLFEPFFTTKPQGKGTGLGLATVYGIVRQSGGYVRVESEPGRGTTFEVGFPRTHDPAQAAERALARAAAGGRETVLVVEDDPQVRDVTARALHRAGYRVLVAGSGAVALELAARERPIDLVVTDVVMPSLDGRAVVDALRAREPAVRVLFVSGYPEDVITHRGVLDSGVEFLAKPFTPTELLARVRAVLDAAPAAAQSQPASR